ncbi:phosphonate ABC transporter, permease protein PhnE [Corynebacterium bovis]|uniref:Phosphonate transport system permease protein n=1 Tax=Corynebacterium bovis DSM 20582 = CIP 54.80 TaxID=927655 RepID=A0A8I0CMM7_9CORY|nr:phosphonate ABC transporter, permease protein PhnE [Corynebacterium bovis]MBB3115889.1 phosphonate transport system permease protein [Corynebacterium bovis DSM 20582 = CIP 54.80]QQC46854.1 phosphonate ABC transporter, permease protein PhnE [Corynebacterium bovis]WJY78524.1 Phosphate-import permease protein PhnE [Corynebacterium bovis DSM 20582 = CIP 54.80]
MTTATSPSTPPSPSSPSPAGAAPTGTGPRDPLVHPFPVPERSRTRTLVAWGVAVVVLVAVHWAAVDGTEFYVQKLGAGWANIVRFLGDAVPPDLSWERVVLPGLKGLLTTLWIGLLGTTFSVPVAFVLAMGAARTVTSNVVVYQFCRSVLSFLRAVPDIVFALIFVTAVGLGPFAGVLAHIFHNTGVMGKLWAEAVEEADQGPQTALRTAGATRLQQIAHATLPVSLPQLTGLLLYRFDVNVRSSLVLGLVGAGGIGLLINRSIKTFRFDEMTTYIIMVLLLVVIVDQTSAWLRKRI